MDVWGGIILILAILGVFAFGFYPMSKLDKFLDENRKAIEKESESCEPSCVMLTNSLTDEEVMEEIRRFRSGHEDAHVLLYDSSYVELSEEMECRILKK
ncbi:MAG: hypothetical protein IJF37_00380 [Lachnospiraceae bacterium]|nr:hypothetical protein [Lachnospiraceae bacterium]MBQ6885891.1 hypothetical protein [Lachnospiraceae bacterium]